MELSKLREHLRKHIPRLFDSCLQAEPRYGNGFIIHTLLEITLDDRETAVVQQSAMIGDIDVRFGRGVTQKRRLSQEAETIFKTFLVQLCRTRLCGHTNRRGDIVGTISATFENVRLLIKLDETFCGVDDATAEDVSETCDRNGASTSGSQQVSIFSPKHVYTLRLDR